MTIIYRFVLLSSIIGCIHTSSVTHGSSTRKKKTQSNRKKKNNNKEKNNEEKNKKYLIGGGIIITVLGIYFFSKGSSNKEYDIDFLEALSKKKMARYLKARVFKIMQENF